MALCLETTSIARQLNSLASITCAVCLATWANSAYADNTETKHCSISSRGAVFNNHFNCTFIFRNLTDEDVRRLGSLLASEAAKGEGASYLLKRIEELSAEAAIDKDVLKRLLLIVDKSPLIPRDRSVQVFEVLVTSIKELKDSADLLKPESPLVAKLIQSSLKEHDSLNFEREQELLLQSIQAQKIEVGKVHDALSKKKVDLSNIEARAANVSLLNLDYRSAVSLLNDAVNDAPDEEISLRTGFLVAKAHVLYLQGDEFGDNSSLFSAVESYKQVLTHVKRFSSPPQWAEIHNKIGDSYAAIGERVGSIPILQKAVSSYKLALEVRTKTDTPTEWVTTQVNLGNVKSIIGEGTNDEKAVLEAIAAYNAALEILTPARDIDNWLQTMSNIGVSYMALADLQDFDNNARHALDYYSRAIDAGSRLLAPLKWAGAQNNLGVALLKISERNRNSEDLTKAITAFHLALEIWTRMRVPLRWAEVQNNLGIVLERLGERDGKSEHVKEAINAYKAALEEVSRARAPMQWASLQTDLGIAYYELGIKEQGTESLKASLQAYNLVLLEVAKNRLTTRWAMTKINIGATLIAIGERETGTKSLQDALVVFQEACEALSPEKNQYEWTICQDGISKARKNIENRL